MLCAVCICEYIFWCFLTPSCLLFAVSSSYNTHTPILLQSHTHTHTCVGGVLGTLGQTIQLEETRMTEASTEINVAVFSKLGRQT